MFHHYLIRKGECRFPLPFFCSYVLVVDDTIGTFANINWAQAFYDAIDTAKGPSLGTILTPCSPYVLLAHYQELPWAAQFGLDPDLVLVSVDLEDTSELHDTFRKSTEDS